MFAAYFDATDWTHAITTQISTQAWQHSRRQSTAWAQWNAYLNQVCLQGCLQFFQAESWGNPELRVVGMNDRQADRTWAVVNGSVITVGNKRIALIPTEVVDQSELEVPQEWIDIPSWAADYYLAVYLTPDMQTLHIAGYATHQQIQQQGQLHPNRRSYHFDIEALTPDLNVLALTIDRYATAQTRAAIAAPAAITAPQAENLIQRLGTPTELWPHLEVPFATWAALLDNSTWHEQLYRQRQGQGITTPVVTRLSAWLQGQFDRAWQATDSVLAPPAIAISTRSSAAESSATASSAAAPTEPNVNRVKVIAVGEGQVGLLVNLAPLSAAEVRIELQIHPIGDSLHLPGETQLRLLSMEGMEIAQAKAAVTETIRLQFRANYGEAFQLEIRCNDQIAIEQFAL
jgi:Protein of unknown function (DUF1822)